MIWQGGVQLDGVEVGFRTSHPHAIRYLQEMPNLFGRLPFGCRQGPLPPAPMLEYIESEEEPGLRFDAERDVLTYRAPWSMVPGSTMLEMSLWLVAELVRQRLGHYVLHAAAVVRDGRGVLLLGPSEAGKTTTALELCRRHRFALYGNDHVVVGLKTGMPALVRGDSHVNCRLGSLQEYSPSLAAEVFGHEANAPHPWRVKKRLAPEALGIAGCACEVPIAHVVFVKLDNRTSASLVQAVSHDVDWESALLAKVALAHEMAALIRGVAFTPFDPELRYLDLFVPSLDHRTLAATRAAFLDALFEQACVVKYRGPLAPLVERLSDRS